MQIDGDFMKRQWPPFLLAAASALLLAACGNSQSSTPPVHINEFFSGTVSQVEQSGAGICVTPDGATDQRCGKAFRAVGSPVLTVGEHVGVAVERVVLDVNRTEDVYFIYSPPPS